MILAAGLGTRMRPLTEHTPKPLLRAGGAALIEHLIFRLRDNGVLDLVINRAWLGGQIEEKLGDGKRYGVSIRYSAEASPLETAGGIKKALPLLNPDAVDDPFLVANGDVWSTVDFAALRSLELPSRQLAHLLLVPNPEHNPHGDFSLMDPVADNRFLLQPVTTKRQNGFTYAGIGLFRPSMFASVPNGVYPLAPVLRSAMKNNQVSGQVHTGEWCDVGTPERLQWLDRRLTRAGATNS